MFIPRNIQINLMKALARSPVVFLTGPRQCGKTMLMRQLAVSKNYTYITLDDLPTLMLAKHNSVGFINDLPKPVLIDEIQRAPELLLAIKQQVDIKRTAGQFALTGSANPLLIPKFGDSLAGRMEILYLYPFSQGELKQTQETFLDQVFIKPIPTLTIQPITKTNLYQSMLIGGFPLVQTLTAEDRCAWFSGYVTNLIERDVKDLIHITDLVDFPKLLNILATRTSGLINFADLSRDSALVTTTLRRYLALLQTLYLLQFNLPWHANIGLRFVKAPKLYFTDTGLLSYVLGLTTERLNADLHFTGKILENFVVTELRKQASWSQERVNIYHFRDHADNEIDIILENPQGKLVAIEVKHSETITPRDFKSLKLLQAKLQPRQSNLIAGMILYLGTNIIPAGDNLFAVPLSALW